MVKVFEKLTTDMLRAQKQLEVSSTNLEKAPVPGAKAQRLDFKSVLNNQLKTTHPGHMQGSRSSPYRVTTEKNNDLNFSQNNISAAQELTNVNNAYTEIYEKQTQMIQFYRRLKSVIGGR